MSPEQRLGIIKSIPKQDKDLSLIKNWQPVALLNTQNKIYSTIVSNRLTSVLDRLIEYPWTQPAKQWQIFKGTLLSIAHRVINHL